MPGDETVTLLLVLFSYEARVNLLREAISALAAPDSGVELTAVIVCRSERDANYVRDAMEDFSRTFRLDVVYRDAAGPEFAFAARNVLVELANAADWAFDAVAFFEDDHAIHPLAVHSTIALQAKLDATGESLAVGLVQYELGGDGVPVLISQGPAYNSGWWVEKIHLGHTDEWMWVLISDNVHQGGFLTTSAHARRWVRSGCLRLSPPWRSHWFYPPIELADSEPFLFCGETRVIVLPAQSDDVCTWLLREGVHHASDKYSRLPGWATDPIGGVAVTVRSLVTLAWSCSLERHGSRDELEDENRTSGK
jgi:hypothetical protein